MYEPPRTIDASTPPAAAPRRRRSVAGVLALLLLVLLAGAGAFGAHWLYNEYQAWRSAEQQRQAAQRARDSRSEEQLAALRARLDVQERALTALSAAQSGDRHRVQLQLVEHLLLVASERLQLARDSVTAQRALELADARLALLDEPRLLPVREALAGERAALGRLPRVDVSGALLALSAIIDGAAQLPLAARVPERFEAQVEEQQAPAAPPAAGWLGQAWMQVRSALGAMFSVRRARGPAPRLLAPEHEAQVYQILQLRLEAVRVALLRGQQPALRETAGSAAHWLRQRFHAEDAGVSHALGELERIGALPLDAPLPDITRSLGLLRAQPPAAAAP